MKKAAVAGVLALLGSLLTVSPAEAAACEVVWGSTTEARSGHTTRQVVDVRAGRHRCFDRLVVDVNAAGSRRLGYWVSYVDRVRADGSGAAVPLRGGAKLQIVVRAPAYDGDGQLTYEFDDRAELVSVGGFDTFRQVAWGGSFEGDTIVGLGVRARLPMRAFVLRSADGSARLVVDVAHRW